MMTPELSHRLADCMDILAQDLDQEEYFAFINRNAEAETFNDLSKDDQSLIEDTEKANNSLDKEENGGSGSGNFGHAGREGAVGGSGKGGVISDAKFESALKVLVDGYDLPFGDRSKIYHKVKGVMGITNDAPKEVSKYSENAMVMYRGTDHADPISETSWKEFEGPNGKFRETNSGMFLTADKSYAGSYGKVHEFGLKADAKMLNRNDNFGKEYQAIMDRAGSYYKDDFTSHVKVSDLLTNDEGLVALLGGYDGYVRAGITTAQAHEIGMVNRSKLEVLKTSQNSLDETIDNGGSGSGNWGHAGREGVVGGSGEGGGKGFFYTEKEAVAATKNSKYTGELGHGTSTQAAESLQNSGFDTDRVGSASSKAVLGNGMYFSDSKAVTDYFAKQAAYAEYAKTTNFPKYPEFNKQYKKFGGGSTVKARINITNPRTFKNPAEYDSATADYAISKGYIKDKSEFETKYSNSYSKGDIAAEYGNSLLKKHDSVIIEKDDMGIMTSYGSYIDDNTTVLVRDSKNIYPYKIEATK